jgi:hypothetical protein
MISLMICTPHQAVFGRSNQKNDMGGHLTGRGDRRGAHRILVGRIERRRILGRPMFR